MEGNGGMGEDSGVAGTNSDNGNIIEKLNTALKNTEREIVEQLTSHLYNTTTATECYPPGAVCRLVEMYCPQCGSHGLWEDDCDDYYVGPGFHCTACGSEHNIL